MNSPAPPLPLRVRALRAFAHRMLHAPAPVLQRLAGPRPSLRGEPLDLQIAALLAVAARISPQKVAAHTPAKARALLEADARVLEPPTEVLASVRDLTVQGAMGRLPARLYLPRTSSGPLPLLVYFHGGGWVVGSLDTHDAVCRVLCARTPCAVLSVDYRLAPEHPYPAAAHDAIAAYRDAHARAGELGVDPARFAVGGDSAGGNLAALTALALRDERHAPRLQLLIYPAVDATLSHPSIDDYAEGFMLERTSLHYYLDHYLPRHEDRRDPAASPLFAASVSGVAPAHLQTAGYDPLRDEGAAYARRLAEAGVAVEHKHYPGLIHGYLQLCNGVDAAWQPYDDAVRALRSALHP